jgi:heparan-sulfate lyase
MRINAVMTTFPSHLFVLSGSPYRGNARMEGRPLRPEELLCVLDLDRPGLEAVKAALVEGDLASASAALLAYYRERRAPGWMTGQSFDPVPVRRVVACAAALPGLPASDDDRRIADAAARHVFHILQPASSYSPHDYGPDIDWDANPVGDIEWACGMHRLQYWDGAVTRCYSATGDERYARLWVGLVSDWIRKNPLTLDRLPFPRSWDAIQVGIRAQRLAGNLPYYLNSQACTPEFLVELLTSLYNHARRIEQMPYPNVDNFVMIETLGLASVAAIFPEFYDAPTWKALVMERLTTALHAQVLADGTHGEFVPAYHLLITRYYLELIDLFGAESVSPEIRAGTERMAEFCLAISAPDRKTFFVGDTNSRLDLRPALATAGRLLNRPDFLAAATQGQEGAWPERSNFAFTDGGFYSFRSGWNAQAVWLGLHCGPEPIEPFHSQFDRGTFELMAFGRMLMIDPGVFNYKSGDPDREVFRRTVAHQCLTLNGANAARAGRCLQWIEDDGRGNAVLTFENASYPGLTHRRTVFFVQRRWFVFVDEALGDATGELDLHFQLTPGPSLIDPVTKTARTDFSEGGNVLVWADPSAPVALEAEEAWYSPKWFEKEPLPAFRYRHQLRQAPARFVTVLAPYEGRQAPAVSAEVESAPVGSKSLRLQVIVGQTRQMMERKLP